jgi:hypothetical protein
VTIHPKYISRRRRGLRYVFIHKSAHFSGRIAGKRFIAGQSPVLSAREAIRISGAMGSKMRYGYCLDEPKVFGDCSPEERACALEAGGMVLGTAERFHGLVARAAALGEGVVGMSPDEALKDLLALPLDEQKAVLQSIADELAIAEAEREESGPVEEPDEDEDGSDRADEEEPAPAPELVDTEPAPAEEPAFAPSAEEPPLHQEAYRISRAELEAMTKSQIDAWAQDHLGLALDGRKTKDSLIESVLADPRVEEPTEV